MVGNPTVVCARSGLVLGSRLVGNYGHPESRANRKLHDYPRLYRIMDPTEIEDGVAAEKIIVSHLTNGVADRTLPMCPYPQTPIYDGAGDVNMAESYQCEERGFWRALESVQSQSSKKASPSSATTRKQGTP